MNKSVLAGVAAGLAVGVLLTWWLLPHAPTATSSKSAEQQPLYWVAPMDDSYRRDKPGKSPMGMDLVPVYVEQSGPEPGVVKVSPAMQQTMGVTTHTVTHGALSQHVEALGTARFNQHKVAHIHSRVSGWVETLHVAATGDPVQQGEPLYTLYSPELVNAQEEYVFALRQQKPALINAARQRLQALGMAADAIKNLTQNREILQTTTYYAPKTGVINQLNIQPGFYIKPDLTLMSIGQLADIWVILDISGPQRAQIAAGQPVELTFDSLPGRQFNAHIDYVYPSVDPVTRTLQARVTLPNAQQAIRPEMLASASVNIGSGEHHLLIPRHALIRTSHQQKVVLALGNGRFKSVPVQTGPMSNDMVAVTQGLSHGDMVVTSAQFLLDSESSKTAEFDQRMAPEPAAGVKMNHDMEHNMEQRMDHNMEQKMDHEAEHKISNRMPAMHDHAEHEAADPPASNKQSKEHQHHD